MKISPVVVLGAALAVMTTGTAVLGQTNAADPALVDRGRYLTAAGDCAGCHTAKGGAAFAGGLPLKSPMGTLVSANITPDMATGIGSWNADQFYRSLHDGRDDQGHHLYPAMPYNYYDRVTRADSDAIFAYLRTVPAASNSPKRDQLPFPLNIRGVMVFWNALFFRPHTYRDNPAKSAEWNRGAYLVEGLGHCGACHTPMNLLSAPKQADYLRGGIIEDWFAPDLTANRRKGLGGWSRQDIVEYLKTGRNTHANVAGPMGDVVQKSTSQLTDADLGAIAVYLMDQPASPSLSAPAPDAAILRQGQAIYIDNCSACHEMQGQGAPRLFPRLAGHAGLQQTDPTTTIRVVLTGVATAPTPAYPTAVAMPAYGWKLSDDQIAAVVTYARNAWGNSAPPVTGAAVAKLRRKVVVAANQPPKPTPGSMARPGPGTLATPGSDSRDNGTAKAGQPAAP